MKSKSNYEDTRGGSLYPRLGLGALCQNILDLLNAEHIHCFFKYLESRFKAIV